MLKSYADIKQNAIKIEKKVLFISEIINLLNMCRMFVLFHKLHQYYKNHATFDIMYITNCPPKYIYIFLHSKDRKKMGKHVQSDPKLAQQIHKSIHKFNKNKFKILINIHAYIVMYEYNFYSRYLKTFS